MSGAGQGASRPTTAGCTVLIGDAGSHVGYAYAQALAPRTIDGRVRLVTADALARERCAAAVHAQAHRRIEPFVDDALALARLAAQVAADGVTHWLPLDPAQAAWAQRERAALTQRLPALRVVGAAGDAAPWALRLRQPQALAESMQALRLPWWPEADEPRDRASTDLRRFGVDVLPLPGPRGAVSDDLRCVVRERLAWQGDVCMQARLQPHPALQALVLRLVRGWGITSAFCLHAVEDAAGQLRLTAIRPRLGGGSAFGAANGCDLFAAHWSLVFGDDPLAHWQPVREQAHVTRQFVELLTWPE